MGPPPGRPAVEAWTMLSMAAALDETGHRRDVRAQRDEPPSRPRCPDGLDPPDRLRRPVHPGLGVGAETGEHAAYGMAFPDRSERAARLEEAVAVIRALWSGGPVTRESAYLPAPRALALPAPDPPPRIVIAGETPAGARRAARIGDGWTASDTNFEARLPDYLEALQASGRRREDQLVLVEVNEGDWLATVARGSPWVTARGRRGPAGATPGPTAPSSWLAHRRMSPRSSMPRSAGRDVTTYALIPGGGGDPWSGTRSSPSSRHAGTRRSPSGCPGGRCRRLVRVRRRRHRGGPRPRRVVLVAQSLGGFTAPIVAPAPVRSSCSSTR